MTRQITTSVQTDNSPAGDGVPTRDAGRNRQLTNAAWQAALAASFFALIAYGSVALTRGDGSIATVWLPNGVFLAIILRLRLAHEGSFFAAIVAGSFAANFASGFPLLTGAGLALANGVEISLAVILTRAFCSSRIDMSDISDLVRFLLSAAVVAPVASGLIAAIIFGKGGGLDLSILPQWVATDGLGMMILAPSILILFDALRKPQDLSGTGIGAGLTLLALTIGLTTVVFAQTSYPLLFLVAPAVLACAFKLGTMGAVISTVAIALIATVFTWIDSGPISLIEGEAQGQALVLQAFIASAFVMGLPIAAILEGRARILKERDQERARFQLLADSIGDAVLRYDEHGRCLYASPSVKDVLGVEPSLFVGTSMEEGVGEDAFEIMDEAYRRLLLGETERERFTFRRINESETGKPVHIEADCTISRDPVSGQLNTVIVSARDVSERVELEVQLKRARLHAENAVRAKSQFLANMSHEIRTPMNGVLGFAELLLQADLPEAQRHHAKLINQSGQTMMLLLNDILDISKIEAGQMVIRSEATDIRSLIADCIQLHRANAEDKGLQMASRITPDIPETVMGDPLRLRQVLLNLLGNAVKFAENGSVSLDATVDDGWINISVTDQGVGIAKDRLEQIFDRFEQADGAISRRYGGTGLGLSISRQLADLMGGKLEVESEPGSGSRFTLSLPLELPIEGEDDPADAAPNRRAADAQRAEMGLRRGQVLLAEDHDINRMLMCEMLERAGQSVTIAKNGVQAIAAVTEAARAGEPFDLVLMDIQMPDCDGYAATRAIRSGGINGETLPIVALTANAFSEDVQAAKMSGMQDHLAKPLRYANLLKVLHRWMPVIVVPDESMGADQEPPAPARSQALQARWQERRLEALDAISQALREGPLEGAQVEDLARTVHKLAGTAGMFGEDELGEKAGALERALRSGVGDDVRRELAQALLEAA